MKNFICTGERIDLTVPVGGLTAGQPYVLGSKVVIVISGGVAGEVVAAATEGVFEISKAAVAITVGQKLYWDSTNSVITNVVPGNTLIGYAYKASAIGDLTGFVTLVDNPGGIPANTVAAIATADGTDAASTQALANATKASVNAILVSLKAAGLMS